MYWQHASAALEDGIGNVFLRSAIVVLTAMRKLSEWTLYTVSALQDSGREELGLEDKTVRKSQANTQSSQESLAFISTQHHVSLLGPGS